MNKVFFVIMIILVWEKKAMDIDLVLPSQMKFKLDTLEIYKNMLWMDISVINYHLGVRFLLP